MDPSPRPDAATGPQEAEPSSNPPAPNAESADLWQEALHRLRHQMSPDTFAGLLGDSRLVESAGDTWIIGVRPHAVQRLTHRPPLVINRMVSLLARREVRLEYIAEEHPKVGEEPSAPPPEVPLSETPSAPALPPGDEPPARPSALVRLLSFDPNSAKGGGFWKMGHYANWFWAAYLGTVAWRVYELVVSGDKRTHKTLWTPPRRFSVSELARAIASGNQRRPNRDQIRGRYRRIKGQRVWRPGAFDLLTRESVARIEWHAGDVHWRPWKPGGSCRPGRSGIRVVYRISVVTSLPLLSPFQVAQLPAQNQVEHERYLANRAQDLVAWEQIALPTLAGLDPEARNPAIERAARGSGQRGSLD